MRTIHVVTLRAKVPDDVEIYASDQRPSTTRGSPVHPGAHRAA
ncbi:hypothetical protein AB0N89_08640 [Amycolatopsis sp. NPDC089917]